MEKKNINPYIKLISVLGIVVIIILLVSLKQTHNKLYKKVCILEYPGHCALNCTGSNQTIYAWDASELQRILPQYNCSITYCSSDKNYKLVDCEHNYTLNIYKEYYLNVKRR